MRKQYLDNFNYNELAFIAKRVGITKVERSSKKLKRQLYQDKYEEKVKRIVNAINSSDSFDYIKEALPLKEIDGIANSVENIDKNLSTKNSNTWIQTLIGIIATVIFGVAGFITAKKVYDLPPELIIMGSGTVFQHLDNLSNNNFSNSFDSSEIKLIKLKTGSYTSSRPFTELHSNQLNDKFQMCLLSSGKIEPSDIDTSINDLLFKFDIGIDTLQFILLDNNVGFSSFDNLFTKSTNLRDSNKINLIEFQELLSSNIDYFSNIKHVFTSKGSATHRFWMNSFVWGNKTKIESLKLEEEFKNQIIAPGLYYGSEISIPKNTKLDSLTKRIHLYSSDNSPETRVLSLYLRINKKHCINNICSISEPLNYFLNQIMSYLEKLPEAEKDRLRFESQKAWIGYSNSTSYSNNLRINLTNSKKLNQYIYEQPMN